MEIDEAIGKRIAEKRKEKRMSQEELATLVNSSQGLIAKIETGNRKIQVDLLLKISDALDVDCDYLLRGVSTKRLSIAEGTGLSEEAIREIEKLNLSDRIIERYQLYAINTLLCSPEGRHVLLKIATYINCDFSRYYIVENNGEGDKFKLYDKYIAFGNIDSSVGSLYTSFGKESLEYAAISQLIESIKRLKNAIEDDH